MSTKLPVPSHAYGRNWLRWALVIGLVIRIVLLWQTAGTGSRIIDERHYTRIASNLISGHGFSWERGTLTSVRPPLFPGMMAALWTVTGGGNFTVLRIVQSLLTLLTAGLIYQIGARIYNPRVGRYAAIAIWLNPTLLYFDFLALTETLFTFLLVAFVLGTIALIQRPKPWTALLTGIALGLGTLTRSILYPLPLLVGPLLFLVLKEGARRKLALIALMIAGYLLPIVPWAVRNTRLQRVVTLVDTMGGVHLRLGNYEHTPEDRMWDAGRMSGGRSWSAPIEGLDMTDGQKDKWAQKEAIKYILAHPLITVRRSFTKFADLWGLEREFLGGVQEGYYHPPLWFTVMAGSAINIAYVLLVLAGAAGLWLAPPLEQKYHWVLLLPLIFMVAAYSLAFGHSRYHVPMMPLLTVYAVALATERDWWQARSSWRTFPAVITVMILAGIWIQQIVGSDAARIQRWLSHAG